MENQITLGPILGVESNELYTVCLLVPNDPKDPKLNIKVSDDVHKPIAHQQKEAVRDHHTFYRFEINLEKLSLHGQVFEYEISKEGNTLSNSSEQSKFEVKVPATDAYLNVANMSCSGSHKYDRKDLEAKGCFERWKHLNQLKPDVMIMSGDQIYSDSILDKHRHLRKLLTSKDPLSPENFDLIDDFYLKLYIDSWSNKDMAWALATIPSIMTWDDHDIIDGYGSLLDKYHQSSLFSDALFPIAKKYFSLFQIRGNNTALIDAEYDFSLGLTFRDYQFILPDTRSHRTRNVIITEIGYAKLNDYLVSNPISDVNQNAICFVLPVPIAHIKFREAFESWVSIGIRFMLSIKKSLLKYSLDDDLLDHWEHKNHTEEQLKMLDLMFNYGINRCPKNLMVLSGDVHFSGASRVSLQKDDQEYVITQLISSPMVNYPMPWIISKALFFRGLAKLKYTLRNIDIHLKNFGTAEKKIIRERNFMYIEHDKSSKGKITRTALCYTATSEDGKYLRRLNNFS